ncbi:hypothetical protein BD410DRAFT_684726, partial [Rickenella mellea]
PPIPLESYPKPEYNVHLTRKITVNVLYRHKKGSLVEYPETMSGGSIGHIFELDPDNWNLPKHDFAYSLGLPRGRGGSDAKGMHIKVLTDRTGETVPCHAYHDTCQGCRVCPNSDMKMAVTPHTKASREALQERLKHDVGTRKRLSSPARIIFDRTVGLMSALRKYGCGAKDIEETRDSDETVVRRDAAETLLEFSRGKKTLHMLCQGRLIFEYDKKGRPLIRCKHFDSTGTRDHLIIYAIGNGTYDLEYLEALFNEDEDEIMQLENAAREQGFGPRAICSTIANSSSVRTHCPLDHRMADGSLAQMEMVKLQCNSTFRTYVPLKEFRKECPFVLVVCSGHHTHPIPLPSNTPAIIRYEVFNLLRSLDMDLPDTTPRRFLRHPIINSYLRRVLPNVPQPMLSDLHISLANRDHLRAYIKQVKLSCFPRGTGWEGLISLREEDSLVTSVGQKYVRYMEEISDGPLISNDDDDTGVPGSPLRIVFCMCAEQSHRLTDAQYLQSDISFRRIVGFKEFELGGWDKLNKCSIIYCRVYLNRQSALAHQMIFQKLDEIVKLDTGQRLLWRHIHGDGIDDFVGILHWTADQHRGQAKGNALTILSFTCADFSLGLGLYLQKVAAEYPQKHNLHEPHRLLMDLSPYEHLLRLFRLCTVHIYRNIKSNAAPEDVKNLMRGLVCLRHDDWDGTIKEICEKGGKPAVDWVNDKIQSQFAFPAMCWEKSFIPMKIWQVGESTSNLIETAHADINREGTSCTLLGGVKRGEFFDILKLRSLKAQEESGISRSYNTHDSSELELRRLKRTRK